MMPADQAAANMPDVWASQQHLAEERASVVMFGGTAYPEPLVYQVMVAARLADKAAREWMRAKAALADYAERHRLADLLDGTGELENLVVTLDRLFRLVGGIATASDQAGLFVPQPSMRPKKRVRRFRQRIADGDEDLADGKAGERFPAGSLEVRAKGIAIQRRRGDRLVELSFVELAATLSEVRQHLGDVIQH